MQTFSFTEDEELLLREWLSLSQIGLFSAELTSKGVQCARSTVEVLYFLQNDCNWVNLLLLGTQELKR
jgi:hypothetical protein